MFHGLWVLAMVFAVCECAQRMTNAFGDINDTIVQLHWYLYPIEIQRLIVQFVMYAQKPVEIAFFGSIQCSRERFRKVSQFFSCSCCIYHDFQKFINTH